MLSITITPLEYETRSTLSTGDAAVHMGRRPQTLRSWASTENGPLTPIKIGNRLHWRTEDIRRVLGVKARFHVSFGVEGDYDSEEHLSNISAG